MKKAPRTVPSKEEKYMGLAFWMASFSKDPNTQMGSVIVNSQNRPLGWGYNGPPKSIIDTAIDWSRPHKYPYIVHAEANAIDHSNQDLTYATLYVTGKPCADCMLKIVTKKISEVIYFPYKTKDKKSTFSNGDIGELSDDIAKKGSVKLTKFEGNLNWMRDRMDLMVGLCIFD